MTRLATFVTAAAVAGVLAATATAQQPVSPATVPASGSDAADLKLVQTVCGGCHARNSMLGTYLSLIHISEPTRPY